MTQLISFLWKNETRNSHGLLQLHVGREALAYCQCLYRENKALFASVDLIGEKNQVILECHIKHTFKDTFEWDEQGRFYFQIALVTVSQEPQCARFSRVFTCPPIV